MKAKVGKEDKGWGKQVIKKPKFLASGTNSTIEGWGKRVIKREGGGLSRRGEKKGGDR